MKIAVIGSGTMGAGIAQVLAPLHKVVVRDIAPEQLEKAKALMEKNFSRNVEKGRMTEEAKKAALANVSYSAKMEDIKDCDLVIEAATENPTIKKSHLQGIVRKCKERMHTCIKYFISFNNRYRSSNLQTGQSYRNALLQSCSNDETYRSNQGTIDI